MQLGFMVWLGGTGALSAAPSSPVAWTPETLKLVKGGDPAHGKILAGACAGCHGLEGISPHPAWPDLAGQGAFYLYKQLQDYKQGTRQNPIMNTQVAALDDPALADLAAFYASLPPPQAATPSETGQTPPQAAEILAKRGDHRRFIPACDSCHGRRGQGSLYDTPTLAGQKPAYVRLTLQAFKSGNRANDLYSRMRLIAQPLNDEEIGQLAHYYGSLGAR
jgi:cytochrome c553